MAELITTQNAIPVTAKASSGVSFTRGLRGALASDGTYALAGIGVSGTIFADTPTDSAGGYFLGAAINGSVTVPAVASEAVAVGDAAYSAASGKCSKTSTNAVLLGVWKQAASADGVVGIIELAK